MTNHTFTRRDPDSYRADELFSVDRAHNAVDINLARSGGNVIMVGEHADQLDDALRAGAADLLGGRYPYARAGFVRSALRGDGRDRWR